MIPKVALKSVDELLASIEDEPVPVPEKGRTARPPDAPVLWGSQTHPQAGDAGTRIPSIPPQGPQLKLAAYPDLALYLEKRALFGGVLARLSARGVGALGRAARPLLGKGMNAFKGWLGKAKPSQLPMAGVDTASLTHSLGAPAGDALKGL